MNVHQTYQSLERELSNEDPWRLDDNPFERERHTQLLRLSLSNSAVSNGLEIGCAAGAFTEKLAPHCKRLTVIDVMPRAIGRAVQRTKRWSHISWAATDILQFSAAELFDLIVVAEVLYYLEDMTQMRTAVDNMVKMLAPGGHLVFGSARDATCKRWGHVAGAETVITILTEALIEVERVQCQGQSADEDCLLVRFRNPEPSLIPPNGRG
ncbi:nodulation methyltransferase NodS [Bradyrhizobium canariense]|uniref:Nodulation protein S n=1 Tax=Bradyrhizobium canariense TaxID=255045 RepID=A0A1X3FWM7_9BRAD|nr:nodulation methyltransferase NodS [Bradyrhizobium canariense]OSI71087.1 SAM-dependent methyltransferase [Bradyrhizobium canariense]OSI79593.1 SAM-dependent methyltransferase [Bradyrhizobium canariense]OSI91277.1 SAM-dependent methyltransferase [Bradyrhizobium canariense]OSI91901.1 SAM-dependent methyltransferase [Bradyrhizobium canariense]OSJ05710.1 SAM-dependent methyltransferase [Bradyrhizobium canariense]